MTPSAPHRRVPGTWLQHAARVIFDEPARSTIVYPAIADFQQEMRDAAGDRAKTRAARRRAWWAFAKLVLVLSVAAPPSGDPHAPMPQRAGGRTLFLLVAVLFASTWPFFGWFMTSALAGGVLFAIITRRWHDRHPAMTVDPATGTRPEINLSAIPVGGNAGGLIFAIGSIVIVIVGLPELRWFLLAAIAFGACAGAALLAWRRAHPTGTLPRNSISLR